MEVLIFILYFLLISILGLLIAFSPMIVIVNLIVVLKSSRPILRTLILMTGMVIPLIIVASLANLLLTANAQISFRWLAEKISIPPLINLAFGLWLIGVGWRRWQYSAAHNGPKKPLSLIMNHPPDKFSGLFTFAFIKSALSITNIFAILVVCNLVITKNVKEPMAVIAILWVILIGLLPFGVILFFYFFKHEKLEQLSSRVDNVLNRNIDTVINLGLIGLGAFFAVLGALHLFA